MRNRAMAFVRDRLFVGCLSLYCLLPAFDVLAGEGYIAIPPAWGGRPLLFFSDNVSATEFQEVQGQFYFVPSTKTYFNKYGSFSTSAAIGCKKVDWPTVQNYTVTAGQAYSSLQFSGFGYVEVTVVFLSQFLMGDDIIFNPVRQVYATGVSLGTVRILDSEGRVDGFDLDVSGYGHGFLYVLPASLNLTLASLSEMPWGWWGNSSCYTVDVSGNVTAINIEGVGDNPNFPPSVPVNPVTGAPYDPALFQWAWDNSSSRWVGHNKWADASQVPSQNLGPTGLWVYGKNPNGNVYNDDPEGSEWYWDGTLYDDVVLPPSGGVDPTNPFAGSSGESSAVDSTQTMQLLSAIEQNTRSAKTSLLGLSTAIPNFRSEVHSDLGLIQQKLIANQTELMSCLNGHHHYVEEKLLDIVASSAASVAVEQDIVSELSTGFGAVSGALSTMGSSLASSASSAADIASYTSQMLALDTARNTKIDNFALDVSGGFSSVGGTLTTMDGRVASAVAGLDRIEGKILDNNTMAQANLDMWASQILHWNESDDQSLTKLQYLCDVADTMKSYNAEIASDSNHMKLFWELEKIRWVQRDTADSQTLTDIEGGLASQNDKTEVTNQKLESLINEVAGIPPVEVPEVDLSKIESDLSSVLSALNGQASAMSGVAGDLETIKYRLGNIDNALGAKVSAGEIGELQLHQVQEDVRDDLQDKLQALWKKLTDFEDGTKEGVTAYKDFGNGRVANPVWFNYDLSWGSFEYELKLDWTDEKYASIMAFRPLWILVEVWFLYLLGLYECYKVLLEV